MLLKGQIQQNYINIMSNKNNNTPKKQIKQNKSKVQQKKNPPRKNSNIMMIPVNSVSGTKELRKESEVIDAKSLYQAEDYMGVNQVLVYTFKNEPSTYYVPCYLRMRVNKVHDINYLQSKAQIETDIRLWFMIGEFPESVQNQIINQACLLINSTLKIQLKEIVQPEKLGQGFIKNKSKFSKGFLLSQSLQLDIQNNPFWSPFELIKLIAKLEVRKIVLGDGNPKFQSELDQQDKHFVGQSVEFNFMDAHPFLQFNFGYVRNLGSFDIAESLVDMRWTNNFLPDDDDEQDQLNQQGEQKPLFYIGKATGIDKTVKTQKIMKGSFTPDAYQHGKILIPLYKYPSTTIINIFVPLYIVGIMNLGVFFQLNDMANRDGSLATFLLAYIAFFPTIRENLPETPKIVLIEILVYIQIVCSLICFFYSLVVSRVQQYSFTWNEDPCFLVCVSLTLANISVVLSLFIIHKAYWERNYNKLPKGSTKYINAKSLNTDDNDEWWNKQCEGQFEQYMRLGLVKPYKSKKIKRKAKKQGFSLFQNFLEDTGSKIKNGQNTTDLNLIEDPNKNGNQK